MPSSQRFKVLLYFLSCLFALGKLSVSPCQNCCNHLQLVFFFPTSYHLGWISWHMAEESFSSSENEYLCVLKKLEQLQKQRKPLIQHIIQPPWLLVLYLCRKLSLDGLDTSWVIWFIVVNLSFFFLCVCVSVCFFNCLVDKRTQFPSAL